MKYAVNVADMAKLGLVAEILVAPVVPQRLVVETSKARFDEMAVVLECEEERAKAIVEVIRLKFRPREMRCYQSSTGRGGWKGI